MTPVIVDLAAAIICFAGACHPALIGPATPTGTFELIQRLTSDPGYGGDVLQFYEDERYVYAVHRIWMLRPDEKRDQRIKSSNPAHRIITKGCVNVSNEVYDALLACCSNTTIQIK